MRHRIFTTLFTGCILFAGIFFNNSAKAQDLKDFEVATTGVEKHLLKLNFIMPGLGYEIGLGQRFSIAGDVLLRFPAGIVGIDDRQLFYIGGLIDAKIQGRYYYNILNRFNQNKHASHNSADYVAIHIKQALYSWPMSVLEASLNPDYFGFRLGVAWGLQRSFNRLFINTELGMNIQQLEKGEKIVPTPQAIIRFGYILY